VHLVVTDGAECLQVLFHVLAPADMLADVMEFQVPRIGEIALVT
jgi:hypothetical protein